MYKLDSSWTYLIIAVGITLYSFYTGVQEKRRKSAANSEIDEQESNIEHELFEEPNINSIDSTNTIITSEPIGDVVGRYHSTTEHNKDLDVKKTIIEENTDNINTLKDRLRRNPKDLVLYSEILRPKYLDF